MEEVGWIKKVVNPRIIRLRQDFEQIHGTLLTATRHLLIPLSDVGSAMRDLSAFLTCRKTRQYLIMRDDDI